MCHNTEPVTVVPVILCLEYAYIPLHCWGKSSCLTLHSLCLSLCVPFSAREYSSDEEPEKKRSRREEASSESEGEDGRGERKRKRKHKRRGSGSLSPHRQKERDGSLTREEEGRGEWWG